MRATERLALKLTPEEKRIYKLLAAKKDTQVGTLIKKTMNDLAKRHGVK